MPGADWLWYTIGAVALLAGGVLALRWWRGDGVRTPRCPWCRYPLPAVEQAAPLPVCPECGRVARRVSHLHRPTRPRWVCAAAAVCITAGGAALCVPHVRSGGVWNALPGWVIWQVARVEPRIGPGFERRLGGIVVSDRTGRSAQRLYDLDRSVRVTRDRWVAGVPVRARTTFNFDPVNLGDQSVMFTVDAAVADDARPDKAQSHHNFWRPRTDRALRGSAVAGREVALPQINARPVLVGTPATWPIAHPLTVVASLDEVLAPHAVPSGALRAALAPMIVVMPDAPLLALTLSDVPASLVPAHVTIGLSATIVSPTGQVLGRGRWCQRAGGPSMLGRPVLVRWVAHVGADAPNSPMPSGVTLASLAAQGCTVRFETDTEMALGDIDAKGYVPVLFEAPLKELVR